MTISDRLARLACSGPFHDSCLARTLGVYVRCLSADCWAALGSSVQPCRADPSQFWRHEMLDADLCQARQYVGASCGASEDRLPILAGWSRYLADYRYNSCQSPLLGVTESVMMRRGSLPQSLGQSRHWWAFDSNGAFGKACADCRKRDWKNGRKVWPECRLCWKSRPVKASIRTAGTPGWCLWRKVHLSPKRGICSGRKQRGLLGKEQESIQAECTEFPGY